MARRKKILVSVEEVLRKAAIASDGTKLREEARLAREALALDSEAIAADHIPHKEEFEKVRKRLRGT